MKPAKTPHEVRIIGGQWKRSKLPVADAPGLRPTPDRVRETLFNWLGQDLEGWRCLDAYAGSGALGFEAASRGADAVVLNLTVVKPSAGGYATVFPCGTDQPNASNLNFNAGQTIPNAVLTKIGDNGEVCIFNSQPTHLVVDANGFVP